ncbi:MAG: beta-galactosidase [Planctomycetes bacterium]|nr:beta-galactosidase [Planctomycetota bacterium]
MANITWDGNSFYIDGGKFWIVSGAVHYFRVPASAWTDVLEKTLQAGLNTVETYVAWNFHESEPGVFDWTGDRDLGRFIDVAGAIGLKVIVRPGPYICSEWDFGGLPPYLLQTPGITTRDMHPAYIQAAERYLDQVLAVIAPRQCTRGGPVIMVQDENEYFFSGRPGGRRHLEWIRDRMRSAGIDVPINCCNHFSEPIDDTIETMNGFSNACELVETLHEKQPAAPALITEFWPGWFTKWGSLLPDWKTAREVHSLAMGMLARRGMYNYYMFFGGTDFGLYQGPFDSTSYDYDSPLTETRLPNDKYYLTRLANLCARNLGPLVAGMKRVDSPPVEGSAETISLSGECGTLHFLRLTYGDTRLPHRSAKIPLGGVSLPLRPTFRDADAVIMPETLALADGVVLDYADLTPLGVLAGVTVLVGDAGAPFRCSVNGRAAEGFVPAEGVLSPLALRLKKADVWIMNHAGASRLFETSSGELVAGYDYVSPSGTGFLFAGPRGTQGAARAVVRRSSAGKTTRRKAAALRTGLKPATPGDWSHSSAVPADGDWRPLKADGELAREGVFQGYGWYRTADAVDPGAYNVFFPSAADRVTVFADGRCSGTWGRGDGDTFAPLPVTAAEAQPLIFLADSLGRENFGYPLEECKGVYGPVSLDARVQVFTPSASVLQQVPAEILGDWRTRTARVSADTPAAQVSVEVPLCTGPVSLLAVAQGLNFIAYLDDALMTWNFRQGHRRHLAFDLGNASGRKLRLVFPGTADPDKAAEKTRNSFLLVERTREIPSSGLLFAPMPSIVEWLPGAPATGFPAFYRGSFAWTEGREAVFRPGRFGKGHVVVNGFNIGRYWEVGPYPVYYVPGSILRSDNEIIVLDEMGRGADRTAAVEPLDPVLTEA